MADRPVIRLAANFPEEMEEHVLPYFDEFLPLLARDLDIITMCWEDMDEDAQIAHNDKYRRAFITVSASWLNTPEEDRWDIAAHELAHIMVNGLTKRVDNLMDWFEEHSNQHLGFVRETINVSEEMLVSDIARLVLRVTGKWEE